MLNIMYKVSLVQLFSFLAVSVTSSVLWPNLSFSALFSKKLNWVLSSGRDIRPFVL
jgi:hypothetical protein